MSPSIKAIFFDANGVLYYRDRATKAHLPPDVYAASIILFPTVVETISALKKRGLKLGVITNTSASTDQKHSWLRARGLDIVWDAFVNSMEVGVRKPHPAIYRHALDQRCVSATESVFVGHEAHELAGAAKVGMTTVAFKAELTTSADYRIHLFAELLALPLLTSGDR